MDDIGANDVDLFGNVSGAPETEKPEAPQREKALASDIVRRIKEDKEFFKADFERMRRDMEIATWGANAKDWAKNQYRANVVGRHVKMKTAALYAKNPKATARRRETLDFAVWDENPASLMMAQQLVQQATLIAQQNASHMQEAATQVDPATGAPAQALQAPLPPGLEQAQAILADFQQGLQRRQTFAKLGKTLEVLFAYYLREQRPLDFKRAMKKVVRRACTTGVAYVKLGFQREMGPRPGLNEQLADSTARLKHLQNLAQGAADGTFDEYDKEMAELEASTAALQAEPEIIVREGLVIDYPQATRIIPDKRCKSIEGFEGCGHVSVEYDYTVDEVKEIFGVDLRGRYRGYAQKEKSGVNMVDDADADATAGGANARKDSLVRVWECYDRRAGVVYYVADGYDQFLRPPAAPDVFVEDFWPIYTLTFNAIENEDEAFAPSDVALLKDMQTEYNRSREGKREHRIAARPKWLYPRGVFSSEMDIKNIGKMKPFEALPLDVDPQTKMTDVFQAFPVPGVDPNLYDVNEIFTDMQLVGGMQEAGYGAVSDSTATESALAANSTNASDAASIDDLDSLLTQIARASSQILLREMSPEQVTAIVGPGAVWTPANGEDILNELWLEVEAGSTGKPNQAVEIANWTKMLPLMMQIPGIQPTWMARETVRRLDDKVDLVEAIAEGIPSIMMMNAQKQGAPSEGEDPNQQGDKGADNAPRPDEPGGSTAPMGSNRNADGAPQDMPGGTVVAA